MSNTQERAPAELTFAELALPENILKAISDLGYERPSPIQAASIPVLQSGADIIGQAQTGTGKTAAFALPLLAKIDLGNPNPQALVLTPTRELAIQVAEAFSSYSKYLANFHVLPIYGGQSISIQLRQLNRGAQVIVGTPGRVMDYMRRGKLEWSNMHTLVLDEADEMLRMGFLEDVEWILQQTPKNRQIALFSATMPKEIRRVSEQFLKDPKEIKIETKTATATTISQKYISVANNNKLDALTRVLEVEETDAVIIFVRTKTATLDLAEKLSARGYAAAAINGDMQQNMREHTIERIKNGQLDILIATDVAARGLDVPRISHVVNYDITQDVESYIHRIGRTGRAGREGVAILFVTPREKRMLGLIERTTKKPIERIGLPSIDVINDQRIENYQLKITEKIDSGDLQPYLDILTAYQYETNLTGLQIAAAIASLAHDKAPLLLEDLPSPREERESRNERGGREPRGKDKPRSRDREPRSGKDFIRDAEVLPDYPEMEMERFAIMVGLNKGIKPSNVVGAIANEVKIESRYIGHIKMFDEFTTVDLPKGMPKETINHLKKVRVCGVAMNIVKAKDLDLDKVAAKADKNYSEQKQSYSDRPRKERTNKDKPVKDNGNTDKASKDKSYKDKPFKDKPYKDKPFKDKPFKDKSGKHEQGKGSSFADDSGYNKADHKKKKPFKAKKK